MTVVLLSLRRPKVTLGQVVIKDDYRSVPTSAFPSGVVSLAWNRSPLRASLCGSRNRLAIRARRTSPNAERVLFLCVCAAGSSVWWRVAGSAAPVGRARLSLKRRRPGGLRPLSRVAAVTAAGKESDVSLLVDPLELQAASRRGVSAF